MESQTAKSELTSLPHKPKGYTVLTPYFTVADADRLIAFLKEAFDGTVIKENRNDNGRVQHVRVQIDDAVIMLNESSDDYPANISQMHLYVRDTEAAYKQALKAGATSIMKPNIRPHGDRMAGVTDPCGNIWWLATYSG